MHPQFTVKLLRDHTRTRIHGRFLRYRIRAGKLSRIADAMLSVPAVVIFGLLSLSAAQDSLTDDFNNKLNNIETKPSARLDPYIRKALLKALSELEEGDGFTTGSDGTDEAINNDSETARKTDFIDSKSPHKETIQIHSFVVNGQEAFANNSNNTPTLLDSNISILSTTAGNVENQASGTRPTTLPFTEIFQTKDSSVNLQQVRSIPSSAYLNTDKNLKVTLKPTKPTFRATPSTTTTTTTSTTTTTTPKPTHNDDGENIEEVDQRDVHVYQAPLVAAFTVHQDAQGLPKKVIPIYQQRNNQQVLTPQPTNALSTSVPFQSLIVNHGSQNEFINHQLVLQKELEEKQRILEEQLLLLQLQQKQQEELLRKQQYLLQQRETQRLQLNFFDQNKLKSQQIQSDSAINNFQIQKSVQQPVNQNAVIRPHSPRVSIQPSVPIEQNTVINQQLPNREAVDFLVHLRSQQPAQFPLQENHLPQGLSTVLHPNPTQVFHQGLSLSDPLSNGVKQSTRIFRQDPGIGNFGFNNQQHYNRFNTFNPVQSNRFFLQQNRSNQFGTDAELKQLLMQTGINGRNTEDLNIVSKVLSLNHGVPFDNIFTNRLSFDSRRYVKPFV